MLTYLTGNTMGFARRKIIQTTVAPFIVTGLDSDFNTLLSFFRILIYLFWEGLIFYYFFNTFG